MEEQNHGTNFEIKEHPEMEIGAYVASLNRYQADDGFDVTVKMAGDSVEFEFTVPTAIDDPAHAIDAARGWLIDFAKGVLKTFDEPGSLI